MHFVDDVLAVSLEAVQFRCAKENVSSYAFQDFPLDVSTENSDEEVGNKCRAAQKLQKETGINDPIPG